MTILLLIGTFFVIIREMFNIFKLSAFDVASKFCEWIQVGTDVYIPLSKYQIKPHSSLWFSAAFAAVMVHRNHFFRLCEQNKSYLKWQT